MNFWKFFLKNWLILSAVLFLTLSCTLLILLDNARYGHPQSMDFLYISDEVNIQLTLILSTVMSILVGVLFTVYDYFLPKPKVMEEGF
jgi:hypothetical protein